MERKICDLNIYQDMAEMTQYIQVPEISDAYIAVKTADEMNGESQEIMQTYMNVLSDLVLPCRMRRQPERFLTVMEHL